MPSTEPEAGRDNVGEGQEAFDGLVVAGCDVARIAELVEAPSDQVTQPLGSGFIASR